MSELLRHRLRVAPEPREAKPYSAGATPRRVELVHVNTTAEGLRAVRLGLDDGRVVTCMVTSSDLETGAAWVADHLLVTGPGQSVTPVVVAAKQWRRGWLRRWWGQRNGSAVFGVPATFGALAEHARPSGDGLSLDFGTGAPSTARPGRWGDSFYLPRVRVVPRGGDEGGAFVVLQPPRERRRSKRRFGGPVIDMVVLGSALGADVSSPSTLCASYGVPWPPAVEDDPLGQLLAEAVALAVAYRSLLAELAEVAPGLAPQDCWSPGSVITHSLRKAGVRAPAESTASLPPWAIGACASAFFGGRTEALLVGVPMPMSMVDLNSTYPSLFSLLGLTPHLAADHFEVRPVQSAVVRRLFDPKVLRDHLDDRGWWATIGALFVQVEPHAEVLPSVREADGRWRAVNAALDLGGGSLWYHAADLVRPALDGNLPRVVKAFRVVPLGTAEGLRPVRLPSGAACDLRHDDYGSALVGERRAAAAIGEPLARACLGALAKGFANSGAWGIFARVDPRRAAAPTTSTATGPAGERLTVTGHRSDVAGPLTLWQLAPAVPAACRAVLAMAQHDIEVAGGSIAAVLTDSLVVPAAPEGRTEACPGGPHRLPDGREAVGVLGHDELRAVLGRFDPLLCPAGGAAWKQENASLDRGTWGLVLGVNKVLLGRHEEGSFRLVRSCDTSLGDHYVDPTGTGERLPDGRTAWDAELQERFMAAVVEATPGAPLLPPRDLPAWADRPALRPEQPRDMADLGRLREALGDPGVHPFTRYVQAVFPLGNGPICVDAGQDPSTWQEWAWCRDGQPARIRSGLDTAALSSQGAGLGWRCRSVKDVFALWLIQNHDVTTGGPERGLRHVLPVRSHPALVQYAGRSAEAVTGEDDALHFGSGGAERVVEDAAQVGSAELARRGVPARTAEYVAAGRTPRRSTAAKLAVAVAEGQPERHCAGCGTALVGRADKRWCSDACRMATARAGKPKPAPASPAAPVTADLDRALDLLAALPGMPAAPLGLQAVRDSKKLRGLVETCLAAPGVSPELLAQRVGADGPLAGRSPVGILVRRLEALGPVLATEAAEAAASAKESARRWGARLGGMVRTGQLSMDGARSELASENDAALRQVALVAFGAARYAPELAGVSA
jgi:hypothetical protein